MTSDSPPLITAGHLRDIFGPGPFTRAEAMASGVSGERLRHAVKRGFVKRVHRGWYAVPGSQPTTPVAAHPQRAHTRTPDLGQHWSRGSAEPPLVGSTGIPAHAEATFRDLAARQARPVLAGSVASDWWRLDTWGQSPGTILVAPGCGVRRGQRHGLLIREAELDESDIVTTDDGIAITGVLRTGADCARGLDPIGALIVVNSAVRRSLDSPLPRPGPVRRDAHRLTHLASQQSAAADAVQAMRSTLDRCAGHGLSAVRHVLGHVDPRLESALEVLSWWRFSEYGLVMPTPQQWVRGASGRLYRVDFDFDGVIGEADGLSKYASRDELREEKNRQTDIELTGKPVVRWGWAPMWHHPEQVIAALDHARAGEGPRR